MNKLSLAYILSFQLKGKRRTCTFTGIPVSLSCFPAIETRADSMPSFSQVKIRFDLFALSQRVAIVMYVHFSQLIDRGSC